MKDQLQQLKFQKSAKIEGYSHLNLDFAYQPSELGLFEVVLQVYLENFLHSPPLELTLR